MILPLRSIPNPDFAISRRQALDEHARMAAAPVTLARPVLVLAGWRVPSITPVSAQAVLCPLTSARRDDFHSISYARAPSIEHAADHAARAARARFPGVDAFDVVAISMGGLVARVLRRDKALGIARLFTLSTPHRGASMARIARPDGCARQMKPGSALLRSLDGALPDIGCALRPYVLLRDWWVAARNCAPRGMGAFWLDGSTFAQRVAGHFVINRDPRVLADIARCLRAEEPLAKAMTPPPMD